MRIYFLLLFLKARQIAICKAMLGGRPAAKYLEKNCFSMACDYKIPLTPLLPPLILLALWRVANKGK